MKLRYSAKAEKFFEKARETDKLKILKKLQLLTDDPLLGKKLKGEFEGVRVVRAWPYRILYLHEFRVNHHIHYRHPELVSGSPQVCTRQAGDAETSSA